MKYAVLPLLLTAASGSQAAPPAVVQAQPLARTLPTGHAETAAAKAVAAARTMDSPKIHSSIATRGDDGRIHIGCVERPTPRAHIAPIAPMAPESEQ